MGLFGNGRLTSGTQSPRGILDQWAQNSAPNPLSQGLLSSRTTQPSANDLSQGLLSSSRYAPPAAPAQDPTLAAVAAQYPGLAKHLGNVAVRWAKDPGDGRQLEYYPPWESSNPNPGKSTVELYNRRLKGQDLHDSVALDMLHYVGAKDPKTGKPVDPEYYALKQQMGAAVGKANRKMDWETYKSDTHQYGPQSYQDWLDQNRTDAYIRGYVSPRMNPEWQQPGMYTPEMKSAGDAINAYLKTRK